MTLPMAFAEFSDLTEDYEEFSHSFRCCVCLDLLYKPIVLSCGHNFCFWCIHQSMDNRSESHCPTCRHPYHHFPTVCQMMHFVLMKMYPVAYKRRGNQTLEEEKRKGIFSPEFDNLFHGLHPNQEPDNPSNPAHSVTTSSCSDRDNRNGTSCANKAQSEPSSLLPNNHDGDQKQILLADVLCAACNELLLQPVVFNCGHVYCGTCIIIPEEGKLTCKVCQNVHPSRSPKVCLDLDNFLEKHFPTEYSLRKATIGLASLQHESATSCSTKASKISTNLFSLPTDGSGPWWRTLGAKIHIGVGCDFCGMYPINGDRYRCKDCVEKIGFDLCRDCYNTPSKLPGRFNQQHTSEHQFELVPRKSIILRLIQDTEPRVDITGSGDDSENPEDGSLVSQSLLNDTEDDQDDTQSAI